MITEELIDETKNGTLEGMSFEGIVCKYQTKHKQTGMFKVKNRAWLDRLKDRCGTNEALYRKLK